MGKNKAEVRFQTALSLLAKGEPVALPTETVYGLAGRIDREKTIEKIFQLKQRPLSDPLIVHCYNKEQALEYISGDSSPVSLLFDFFSPGPLTVLARKNHKIPLLVTAGKSTAAFRIPQHPLIRKILKKLKVPLAAPSANLYGQVSPVCASHVVSSFKGKVPVLNGGACLRGLESSIVWPDMKKKKIFILRPGMITKEQLESFVKKNLRGFVVEQRRDSSQPGGQKSHYRPPAPLYIIETEKSAKETEMFLLKKFPGKKVKRLILPLSPDKTARQLYSRLRTLSKEKNSLLFVQKSKHRPEGQLWQAIWDRLSKASSGRLKL